MQSDNTKHPTTKEDNLFRSNFAQFNLSLMDIETMGGGQVDKDGKWKDVCVVDYHEMPIGNTIVKVPTLDEIKRLLLLFGRDKDLKRITMIG